MWGFALGYHCALDLHGRELSADTLEGKRPYVEKLPVPTPVGFSHRAGPFHGISFLLIFQGSYYSPHCTGEATEAQRLTSLAQGHSQRWS